MLILENQVGFQKNNYLIDRKNKRGFSETISKNRRMLYFNYIILRYLGAQR